MTVQEEVLLKILKTAEFITGKKYRYNLVKLLLVSCFGKIWLRGLALLIKNTLSSKQILFQAPRKLIRKFLVWLGQIC